MKKSIFALSFIVLAIYLFSGCEPDSVPPVDSGNNLTVKELADLTKTPDQVIPWQSTETDSVWIVYTDLKLESINAKDKSRHNLDIGQIGTFRFTAFAGTGNSIFLSSPADIILNFDLTSKSYVKILNTISVSQPQTNPNTIHYSTDSTFLVKGYKPFKWNGTQFNPLSVAAPYDIVTDFMKVGNSYFWFSRDNINANLYYLVKSSLTFTGIKKVNEGSFANLVFHSNDNVNYGLIFSGSSITGYVFEGSNVISQVSSFPALKLKEFNKTAFYIKDGSLYELSISPINGTISGAEKINKSELNDQSITNYWVYGKQYFLFLSNNKLVSVKL